MRKQLTDRQLVAIDMQKAAKASAERDRLQVLFRKVDKSVAIEAYGILERAGIANDNKFGLKRFWMMMTSGDIPWRFISSEHYDGSHRLSDKFVEIFGEVMIEPTPIVEVKKVVKKVKSKPEIIDIFEGDK